MTLLLNYDIDTLLLDNFFYWIILQLVPKTAGRRSKKSEVLRRKK